LGGGGFPGFDSAEIIGGRELLLGVRRKLFHYFYAKG
jgi:hypothetical protein